MQMPGQNPLLGALSQLVSAPCLLSASKRASVALILRPSSTASLLDVLFIQRSPRSSDPWSAHIAFPGGTRHSSDLDDFATAVREVREEIGLDLLSPNYAFVARLNDRPIYRHNPRKAVLSAFMFLQLDTSHSFTLQQSEVASCFWIPFNDLHSESSTVCTHLLKLPDLKDTLSATILSKLRQFFGFSNLYMPALDVLPQVNDLVVAIDAPYTVLWGLTLSILGDVVEIVGFTRVDSPSLLPDSFIATALLRSIARARRFLKHLFWYRPRTLDDILSEKLASTIE